MMERVIKLIFKSSFGKHVGNSYTFDFEEPVRNIVASRIGGVVIKRFATMNNSYVYYLRTDALFMTRTHTLFNAKPDQICFSIPNNGTSNSIFRYNETDTWYQHSVQNCQGVTFTLLDENGNTVNPLTLDPSWSFTVELEYKING